MSYVASAQVSLDKLQALLEKYDRGCYYFLRWTHKVGGIQAQLKDFPSPEGQLFNAELELRWKQVRQGYQVLILSQKSLDEPGFLPLPGEWEHEDHAVLMHDRKNPQYPNEFNYGENVDSSCIRQRYFRNVETLAVQFIALTVKAS